MSEYTDEMGASARKQVVKCVDLYAAAVANMRRYLDDDTDPHQLVQDALSQFGNAAANGSVSLSVAVEYLGLAAKMLAAENEGGAA